MIATRQQYLGFTLIEVIIILVAVSILMTVIMRVFDLTSQRSADPMLRVQATAIAQGYLEEALLKAYADPQIETGSCEEGAANRSSFDDVNDYACISASSPQDQYGVGLIGLTAFAVNVSVTDDNLGAGANQAPARRVQVDVTHSSISRVAVRLVGWRAQIN